MNKDVKLNSIVTVNPAIKSLLKDIEDLQQFIIEVTPLFKDNEKHTVYRCVFDDNHILIEYEYIFDNEVIDDHVYLPGGSYNRPAYKFCRYHSIKWMRRVYVALVTGGLVGLLELLEKHNSALRREIYKQIDAQS